MDADDREREELDFAAQDGDLKEVKRLVGEGVPVDKFDEIGMTPLHYAADAGHLDVARFLIASGADVNAHDEAQIGETPLGQVAGNCSYEMAELLVDAGADPTIPCWMQITALDTASRRKRGHGPRVHQLLLEGAKRTRGTRA